MSYYVCCILIILALLVSAAGKQYEIAPFSREQSFTLRGILAMMVIMNHMFSQAYMLGNIAVSLFLFFSGYGLAKAYRKKGVKYFDVSNYWSKKLFNIFLPYCGINIMYICWFTFIDKKQYRLFQVLRSFFTAEIMSVAWYTIIIMVLYAIFFFVFKSTKIKESHKIYVLFAAVCVLIVALYLI